MKSLREQAFSTSEREEENKERERNDDQPAKHEGVWISQTIYRPTP